MRTDFRETFCSTDHKPTQKRFLCIVIHSQHVIFYMINRQFLWFRPNWIDNFSNRSLLKLRKKYCNFFCFDFVFIDYNQILLCLVQIIRASDIYRLPSIKNHLFHINHQDNHLFLYSPLVFLIKNKIIFFREFVTLFWNNYKTIDLKHSNPKQFKRFVVVELNVFGSNNDRRNNIKFKILLAILLKPPFD